MRAIILLAAAPLLVALACVCYPSVAAADEYETVPLDHNEGRALAFRTRARTLATPAGQRSGGYGYVTIELHNPDEKPHVVGIRLVPVDGYYSSDSAGSHEMRKAVRIEAKSSMRLHLPLVNTNWGVNVLFTLDGRSAREAQSIGGHRRRSGGVGAAALSVGSAGQSDKWHKPFLAEIERVAVPRRRGTRPSLPFRTPAQLPDQWTLLSGFDLVLVDARAAGLEPKHEQLLLRYVAAGGSLIIHGLKEGADGPLAGLLKARDGSAVSKIPNHGVHGFHGLGRWIVSNGDPGDLPEPVSAWLHRGTTRNPSIVQAGQRSYAGNVPSAFWLPLEIPGLGEVPVQLFFFLLLAFVIFVGPVSYMYFRRRRRLPMLLVTIPAIGSICTVLILGYGMFSEGFGVIGSARSFTVLDQTEHVASSFTGRTLYAGLQPSGLAPDAASFLYSSGFHIDGGRTGLGSMFHANLDGGLSLDGSALPSRAPTPFVTAWVGRARERLRFRRRADGGFDVLASPGFTPESGAGAILLRARDGTYYVSGPTGALMPLKKSGKGLRKTMRSLLWTVTEMPLGAGDVDDPDEYWYRGPRWRYRTRNDVRRLALGGPSLSEWLQARLGTLQPGSYLARTLQAPGYDDLGLDVEYRSTRHLVYGLLGEEDIIDEIAPRVQPPEPGGR